ncbi:unnamed protein product [Psylliodes chrysocephalus]|uniref:Uncharacterized protein n=1 Tax=Psylliodes chrysocephalus TaxID=3402493 RepID=A0A9P0G3P7_9CUCU|nr:unnamed protein product [Psylliodes chrysocephala]
MSIGNVDREETKKILSNKQRQSREIERLKKYKSESCNLLRPSCSSQTTKLLSGSASDPSKYESSSDLINPNLPSTSKNTQMRPTLPTLALVCDKYGISTARKEFESDNRRIRSLYFDGRKDKTLLQEKKNGRLYKKTVVEEHISLNRSILVMQVTPTTGTAKSIEKAVLDFFAKNNLELDDLAAVGCDGTAVNTGNKNGVIRYIETELKCPCQWYICQRIAIKTFRWQHSGTLSIFW